VADGLVVEVVAAAAAHHFLDVVQARERRFAGRVERQRRVVRRERRRDLVGLDVDVRELRVQRVALQRAQTPLEARRGLGVVAARQVQVRQRERGVGARRALSVPSGDVARTRPTSATAYALLGRVATASLAVQSASLYFLVERYAATRPRYEFRSLA